VLCAPACPKCALWTLRAVSQLQHCALTARALVIYSCCCCVELALLHVVESYAGASTLLQVCIKLWAG
jgi:hypothetical protein